MSHDYPPLDSTARTLAEDVLKQHARPTDGRGARMVKAAAALLTDERQAADAWIAGGDTGSSSLTIWVVMTGRGPLPRLLGIGSTPSDADDFGRCYRLLRRIPAWRPRLLEVAQAWPEWMPLVLEWDRLTKLYEKDLTRKSGWQLYGELRRARAADRRHKRSEPQE